MSQVTATATFYAYISSAWVQLHDVAPIHGSWGINDNNPNSRIADPGEMTLALNNDNGLYTPGGPSALAGWKKGIPFKAEFTFDGEIQRRWRGVISDIRIVPNIKDPKCYITVLDWMDYAARHPIINPGIQTNKTGDQVLTTVMSEVEVQPQATDFDTGIETFPTAFDTVTSKTKAYNEFAKVALSELGYVYLKKDKTYGETLVFEAADFRHGWRPASSIPLSNDDSGLALNEDGDFALNEDGDFVINDEAAAITFDGSIVTDFETPYGTHVINRMTVYANPRRLSASPQVLFQLDHEIVIGSGQTLAIKGTYADPNGGLPINGQDMLAPVVTTDYTVFTATGGGGSNISASLSIVPGYGTEAFTHTVTNSNASVGYINKFNCRGTGIFNYNPIEHAATNSASITEFGTESETLNQKYKNDLYSGSVFVESVVDEFKQPRVVLDSISFCANKSNACMMAFLYTDVGSLHYVSIPEAGIAGNYYIQGIEFDMSGGIIMVKWIVKAALSLLVGLSPLAVEFSPSGTTDMIDYGYIPYLFNMHDISYSAWIYLHTDPPTVSASIMGNYGNGTGSRIYIYPGRKFRLEQKGGIWSTDINTIPLNTWTHVISTRNSTVKENQPKLYINGVSQTVTETTAQPGNQEELGMNTMVIGNLNVAATPYSRPFDGVIFDAREYNRILTAAEVTTLYNGGTPLYSALPTDGLVFQGLNVRTGDTASYIGQTLTSALTLRDNISGYIGTPHGSPIGRAAP